MIISFIGEPCVGKGTIIASVHRKLLDHRRTAILTTSDIVKKILTPEDLAEMRKSGGLFPREAELRAKLLERIEVMFAFGAEIVLLDGFPRFGDQAKWFRQNLWSYPLQVFRVMTHGDFELCRRAASRNRDEFDNGELFLARLNTQRVLIEETEKVLMAYSLPYSTIMNTHINQAVDEVMRRITLPKQVKIKE